MQIQTFKLVLVFIKKQIRNSPSNSPILWESLDLNFIAQASNRQLIQMDTELHYMGGTSPLMRLPQGGSFRHSHIVEGNSCLAKLREGELSTASA